MKNLASLATVALANSICARLHIQPHDNYGSLPHGSVCLANDSLFSQATLQVEQTTYGIGYADPNRNKLVDLLNSLAPTRSGPRNARITVYDETEPFETVDYKTVKRAELGDFREVKQRTSTRVTRAVLNRGLTCVLDTDQLIDKPNWRQMHTEWLIDLLSRASILEVLALYAAIAATDTYTWNANANPDLDLKNLNVSVLAPATGFKANRAVFGEEATLKRQIAYEPQNNAGAYAAAPIMTDEGIAARIGVDRVRTNVERYNTAGVKNTFLGSKVLLFTSQDQESPEDASNIVRHTANTGAGGAYAVYVEERLKKTLITVENYELFATQHTSGVALITIN